MSLLLIDKVVSIHLEFILSTSTLEYIIIMLHAAGFLQQRPYIIKIILLVLLVLLSVFYIIQQTHFSIVILC